MTPDPNNLDQTKLMTLLKKPKRQPMRNWGRKFHR